MNFRQVRAVLRKETWHIVRDRRTAVLVTLSPVVFLVALAYSFSVEIRSVELAVMDLDKTAASRSYLAKLTDSGDLVRSHDAATYDELERRLLDGSAKVAVVVPRGFMADLDGGMGASVQVIVDGTSPSTAEHAIQHIVGRTQAFGAQQVRAFSEQVGLGTSTGASGGLAPATGASGGLAPATGASGGLAQAIDTAGGLAQAIDTAGGLAPAIEVRQRTLYNPSLKFVIGVLPALIGLVLALPAVSASLAIVREKEWGTLERLVSTPIGRTELLVGKLLPYVGSGMLSVVLAAAVAVFWFHVPFRGSFATYLLLSLDFLVATMAIGLLISVVVSSQQAAMIAALLIFLFPAFFLSGIFIPLSAMGEMKLEAYMMPTTHYVFINRGLFVKGVGLDVLWPWALALLIIGVTVLVIAAALFRKRLD